MNNKTIKEGNYNTSLLRITEKIEDNEIEKFREDNWKQGGLSGKNYWKNIDSLPLSDNQKACVLEWLAQKLQETDFAKKYDIWEFGKSYDPLSIEPKRKVAHSYVMHMSDGGRHHPFNQYSEIEEYILEEFFNEFENY